MTVNGSKDLTGDIFIARREFLGNVTASVVNQQNAIATSQAVQSGFATQAFNINPGLGVSFPWLSQVAKNFTLYEFEGLIYEYKPLSGEFGNLNTNALGKVVMATQYDPDAPPFASTVQMENYDYATACKPAEHMLHGVETKVKQRSPNMLYVRTGTSSKDEVLTDLGDFQISTEGVPLTIAASAALGAVTTVVIGELWVAYKCRLSRANIFTGAGTSLPGDVHLWKHTGGANPMISATGTAVTAVGGTLARLYNVNVGTSIGVPKLTNSMGTQLVSISNGIMVLAWSPGTSGTFLVTGQMFDADAEICKVILPAQATQANLNTAITNGLTTPGLVGAVSPATVTFATGAIDSDPWVSTGNGLTNTSYGGTTVGGNFCFFVNFAAQATQVPAVIITALPNPWAGTVTGSLQVTPIALSVAV